MTRRIFLFFLAFVFSLPIFSVDYGAVLSSKTNFSFEGKDFSSVFLEQKETLLPYIKIPAGNKAYFAAEAEVSHKLERDFDASENDNNLILDLTLLKFSKTILFQNARSLEISAGRMFSSDATGIIFAQRGDGAFVKFTSPSIEVSAYGAYSGFQNIKNVQMLSSSGPEFFLTDEKKIYDFAAPFAIADVLVLAPYLFKNQTLGFEAGAAIPAKGPSELPDDEEVRAFATLFFNGPILPRFFYKAQVCVEVLDFKDAALFAKADFSYYATFKNAAINFFGLYASGKNGSLCAFRPLTKNAACISASEPAFSGIAKAGLSASIVPVKPLFISLGADAVFDVSCEDSRDAEFYGVQTSILAKYQAASDLQISLGATGFFGKDAAENKIDATLSISLSF